MTSQQDFSRRQFAGIAGAAAASTSLPAARATPRVPRQLPAKWQPKKAVKFGMVHDGASVQSKFQMLVDLGFDGVELDSPNNLQRAEVQAAAKKTGLAIHGIVDAVHWRDTLSAADPATRARGVIALEGALDDAAAYGASTVLLVPAVVNKNVSYRDAYTRSQAEIRKVLPKAEELGVKIALENVWNSFLLSPLETARYIDELESDAIGAYLDPGNLVRFGWPEHWVDALGKRILKVDVKDYSRDQMNKRGPWAGFATPIGEGDTDWPAVVQALKGIGYDGWFTAEVEGGDRNRLQAISERMAGFLKPA